LVGHRRVDAVMTCQTQARSPAKRDALPTLPSLLTMMPLTPLLARRQYQNAIWTDFLVQVCIRFTHSSWVSIAPKEQSSLEQ